jgi:hypothetical protein
LRLGIACRDLVADFAPQVQVIAQRKARRIAVVDRRLGITSQRPRIGLTLA